MPLKLLPPKEGRPYFRIRGTYLGHYVERSTKTGDRRLAQKMLRDTERAIAERGVLPGAERRLTFKDAAVAYASAMGSAPRLGLLLDYFGETPIEDIDQTAIDQAAQTILPNGSAATRNREIYTPVSAILKRAGHSFKLKRPKGWRGSARTDWLQPEEAFRVLEAARTIDAEFGIFLTVLCYTGMRLSEATVHFKLDRLSLADGYAYVPHTKNGTPRAVFLPPIAVKALAGHPRGLERTGETVFRFRKNGRLYALLARVAARASRKLTFHLFRHTYGAWMRRYAGLDTSGLIGTGTWKDAASVRRYEHVVASEESQKAVLLPTRAKSGQKA